MPKQKQDQDQGRKQTGTSREEQSQDDRLPQRRDGGMQDDQERMEPADQADTLRQNVRLPDRDTEKPQGEAEMGNNPGLEDDQLEDEDDDLEDEDEEEAPR